MTVSVSAGPLFVWGQSAPLVTGGVPSGDYNPDVGLSAIAVGTMLPDGRYPLQNGLAPGSTLAIGFANGGRIIAIDQVPSTIATANIAALAHAASGVAMTLVASSGAGITVTTTATTIQQTGKVVPSGSRVIDSVPTIITFGTNATMAVLDARKSIARAVSITGVSGGAGGAFAVAGYDLYGYPQTEIITAGAGAGTTNGAKGWKFITSVTPQFTDAHNYSVGTADIFEFPIAVYEFAFADIVWSDTRITASTGFVAAVTTAPTATTGSVRGTYAVQSASDGTKRLQVFIDVAPWNAASLNGTTSVFGQVPA